MVRELRYRVSPRGFRTRSVTLVTTLLDAEAYPLEALAELYGTRWRVEQYLRDLKQTMKMDVLRCKTVDGVLKELMVYGIVYNLVRSGDGGGGAAAAGGRGPDQLHRRAALAAGGEARGGDAAGWWSTRRGRAGSSPASGSGVPSSSR